MAKKWWEKRTYLDSPTWMGHVASQAWATGYNDAVKNFEKDFKEALERENPYVGT